LKDFRKQKVWERSHRLTVKLYEITATFPKEELYGFISQIRRSCSAVPANIAEGCGKDGDAEFGRYLQIARGSVSELEYHLLLAHDLGFLTDKDYEDLHDETNGVKQMLTSFITKLKADSLKPKA
jgi:four helix bundle protein